MKQIYSDLWQTRPEHPFRGVTSHAYLFQREGGNVLFYSSGAREDYTQIEELGGIAYQYLSHRDEVGPALAEIKQRFGSKLCCHRLEEPSVRGVTAVDEMFDRRETRLDGVEIIPTPGHTDGSTCFLVNSTDGKTYLFTGDTIFMDNGAWKVRINRFSSQSRRDIKESLMLLRNLEPTVVISSASVGAVPFKEVSAEEWQAQVDSVLDGLR